MIQKSYLTKKTQPSAHAKYAHRYTHKHAHVEACSQSHTLMLTYRRMARKDTVTMGRGAQNSKLFASKMVLGTAMGASPRVAKSVLPRELKKI